LTGHNTKQCTEQKESSLIGRYEAWGRVSFGIAVEKVSFALGSMVN